MGHLELPIGGSEQNKLLTTRFGQVLFPVDIYWTGYCPIIPVLPFWGRSSFICAEDDFTQESELSLDVNFDMTMGQMFKLISVLGTLAHL